MKNQAFAYQLQRPDHQYMQMKRFLIRLTMALSLAIPFAGYGKTADSSQPYHNYHTGDTIPQVKPAEEQKPVVEAKPATTPEVKLPAVIKSVPKARRQIKPLAIPQKPRLKPVIVKPKIVVKTGLLH